MSASSLGIQQLPRIVSVYQSVKCSASAATFLLLFDLAITFDDEIELVWRSPNTPPKFFYFVSRYFGIATQLILVADIFPLYCRNQLYFKAVSYNILHLSVEWSLIIRIYALWGRSIRMACLLIISFLIEFSLNTVLTSVAIPIIMKHSIPYPDDWPIAGCVVTYSPQFFNGCWIPMLLLETLLFVLNTIKCLSYRPLINTPVVIRIFRDGTFYYALMCIMLLVRTITLYHPSPIVGDVVDTWMIATFSLTGSRLMLSIRKLAAERQRRDLTLITPAISVSMPAITAFTDIQIPRESSSSNFERGEIAPGAKIEGIETMPALHAQRRDQSDSEVRPGNENDIDEVAQHDRCYYYSHHHHHHHQSTYQPQTSSTVITTSPQDVERSNQDVGAVAVNMEAGIVEEPNTMNLQLPVPPRRYDWIEEWTAC